MTDTNCVYRETGSLARLALE